MATTAQIAQAFPFVHPALAVAGLCAALIPVVIHLINRRRYKRVPWAAMYFLLAANRRSARRVRLEHFLLLAVRTALVALLGLAVARPFVSASPLIAPAASRVHRIIAIDNSLSMNAQAEKGKTRFDAAAACASRLVSSFPVADAVSIITLAEPASAVLSQASFDRRYVRERLAAIRVTQRPADPTGAIGLAQEMLKDPSTTTSNKVVYFISDFPRRLWRGEGEGAVTPTAAAARRLADSMTNPSRSLNLIVVEPGASDNVAVSGLTWATPLLGTHVPVGFTVQVRNFGASTVRDAAVQLRRDGDILRREQLPRIEPGRSVTATVSTEFSTPGTHVIEARLQAPTGNHLADDDVRYLSVEIRDSTRVLVIDGRPGAKLLDGQAGFLAAALGARADAASSNERELGKSRRAGALVQTKVISESEMDNEPLASYDVIALCNVPSPNPQRWSQLEKFLKSGGGLMVFLGDLINADNYNRYGFADANGVLPGKIGRAPETTGALTLKPERLQHPIVAELADHPTSGLFAARFDRYMPIDANAARAEIVLSYSNGAPAAVAGGHGEGRIVVFTSTANMEWNNLPAKGDYVSLMLGTVSYLSPRRGEGRNLNVGEFVREPLSPMESSLPLSVTIGEGTAVPSVIPHRDGLALQYGPIESAGVVKASIGSDSRAFAVNIDHSASNLSETDPRELAAAVDRPVQITSDVKAVEETPLAAQAMELSSGLTYLVIALLLIEPWIAMLFASARGGAEAASVA